MQVVLEEDLSVSNFGTASLLFFCNLLPNNAEVNTQKY